MLFSRLQFFPPNKNGKKEVGQHSDMDNTDTKFKIKEWERKRKYAMLGYFCQSVCLGMEYSLTFITLWLYLDDMMKVKNAKLFYSLISAAYLLSQILSSVIIGTVADKHQNTLKIFFIGNLVIIVGNILYTIPLSPWYLFFGRLISGGGGCLRAVITAEIVKSYPPKEQLSKFSIIGMAFALGFLLGPAINFFFLRIDVWIGKVHVTYANAPGMYLSVLFIIMEVIAIFLIRNVSQEFNMKENLMLAKQAESCFGKGLDNKLYENKSFDKKSYGTVSLIKTKCRRKDSKSRELSVVSVLWVIITHKESGFIVIFSFGLMYCLVLFDLWQPLAVVLFSKWTVLEINIIILAYGVVSVACLLTMSCFAFSNKGIVYLSWFCTPLLGVLSLVFLVLKVAPKYNWAHILLWTVYVILFSVVIVLEEVFLVSIMARMTHHSVQTQSESARLGFSRLGALSALLTAAFLFDYLQYISIIIVFFSVLVLIILVVRRKELFDPPLIVK